MPSTLDTHSLPKIELHCHLDGLPDPEMIRAIRREDPSFPLDPDEVEKAYPVDTFEQFWEWLTFFKPIRRNLKMFYPVVKQHMQRLKAQNVRYAEWMISSGEIPEDPAEAVDTFHGFREWVNQQEQGEIQIEFIGTFGRGNTHETAMNRADRFLALHKAGLIAGVALAGPEPDNPLIKFKDVFKRLHDAGIKIEIHAGEWVGPESVWEALEYGFPTRIGHGVTLFQDERLIEMFAERQIHVEMCPTSNLKTGSISRIEDHPIQRARDLKLNYSVSTDDPGIFSCTMNSEYDLLATTFGFDEAEFKRIYANTAAARFNQTWRIPEPDSST